MKRVRDVMSRDLIAVPPTMDLSSLARLFSSQRITGAPVIDDHGVLLGVVSQSDLTEARAREVELHEQLLTAELESPELLERLSDEEYSPHPDHEDELDFARFSDFRVQDVMSPSVHAIEDHASLRDAAFTMASLGVRRLLVTDGERFVGIVTASDLARAWCDMVDETRATILRFPRERVRNDSGETELARTA